MKFWMINQNSQKLIISTDFETIEDARQAAVNWNKEADGAMRVDIIMNASNAREATKVTTVA